MVCLTSILALVRVRAEPLLNHIALPKVAEDLSVSVELVSLCITVYLISQCTLPSLWAPISDAKVRRVACTDNFLAFLQACVVLAETQNYATLVVLACLQSIESVSAIITGSNVLEVLLLVLKIVTARRMDIHTKNDRVFPNKAHFTAPPM